MTTKCFNIGLAILIFALVPFGHSESFTNRPTQAGMEDLVTMGTD
ncbi:MAG: hypothetical protein Q7J98_03290 [Kiritimatiellia bacterium]|nr:hypothetical protein [Kiritimatiellia bacterium]